MAMGMMGRLIGLACLSLAACSDKGRDASDGPNATAQIDDGNADCAIGVDGGWAHDCRIDRAGDLLTLRHPDGGFRRLRIVTDGRGLVSADGAERAKLTIIADRRIEVAIGPDRYRLPATVANAAP
ncbi:hypothetical protein PMI04_011220 [Sphingobium sp. AP49]|uniref:hypothetical protein n=1 Tax=Sphingobium sp. AP49 TaxID=1144307 RepID=UPI0005642881|nr:hypothetical protein [Sphingobium sp. AP49]WHO37148.1 hypothetical protein PMI04_011220 [Sphingobium sp. AP49]